MASRMDESTLQGLKYRELQKLAKENGIKANQPKATLVQELVEKSKSDTDKNEDASMDTTFDKESPDEVTQDLNVTFDKEEDNEKSVEAEEIEEASEPKDKERTLNKTFDKVEVKESPVKAQKSSKKSRFVEFIAEYKSHRAEKADKSLDVTGTPTANKSRLSASIYSSRNKIPLRKSLVGTPGSVTKSYKASPAVSKVRKVAAKESHIPRLAVSSTSTLSKSAVKKVPDFAKMHAKEFSKMESLDVYHFKRKDRKPTTETKAVNRVKASSNAGLRRSPRNVQPEPKAFVASAVTLKEAKFDFGAGRHTKRPFKFTATPQTETPSKVLGNITNQSQLTATPGSTKKAFNLKTSLAKPLGYKPYTGKLKPYEDKQKERIEMAKKSKPVVCKKNVIKGVRMNKRAELLMKHRNIKN